MGKEDVSSPPLFRREDKTLVSRQFVKDGNDVRMIERRGRARFLLETPETFLFSSKGHGFTPGSTC
jgi:hypothetical protein